MALAPEECACLSAAICRRLEYTIHTATGPVLAFLPFRNEPDLRPLMAAAGTWAIPRTEGKALVWHRYHPERVGRGAFGIDEPHPDCAVVDPEEAVLALVPVVACDRRGYRIGYGGGYYDRFFSRFTLPALAVSYGQFVFDTVPTDTWDRPLGGIATEEGVLTLRQ